MKLLAHLTLHAGERKEQSLKSHSYMTAKYASESLGQTKFSYTAYLAGLLHDCGKATRIFNRYLEALYKRKKVKRGSVNHTFAGVIYLFEKFHTDKNSPMEKLTCEIIAFAAGSHHGMFDCVDLNGSNGFKHRLKVDREMLCYEEAIRQFFDQVAEEREVEECFEKATEEITDFFKMAQKTYDNSGYKVFFQISMLSRMILSAVIEGDRRDTVEYMTHRKMTKPEKKNTDWSQWYSFFEEKISELDKSSLLNQVRQDISRQCLEFAERPAGIYRINAPTGGGKTLSLLRYALAHASSCFHVRGQELRYAKKRIIFITPLLSVLDQNAQAIRDYVPYKNDVLEHHSNVVCETMTEEELDSYELLAESWSAPVIVSTLVQFLDNLFQHRTSAIRRMQALCDSVIIIDEIQILPPKVTTMFNMAINFLQKYCNATIILSSATQPCFEELNWSLHLAKEPDMVSLNSSQLQIFERAEVIDRTSPYGMDLRECTKFCGDLMKEHSSLLIVCNTKTQAQRLFQGLQKRGEELDADIFHLSTFMSQEHRVEELEDLQKKLILLQKNIKEGRKPRKVICVATQIMEAGMDISFEAAVRVLAGMDNLVQIIGRCNRSNEYGNAGKVYLINLKHEELGMLQDIKYAQISMRKVMNYLKQKGECSLISKEAVHKYYQYLFDEMQNEVRYPIKSYGTTMYLADLLSNNNGSANNKENSSFFLHQPFKTVGKEFEVFEKNTIDVLVPYKYGKKLIEQLKNLNSEEFNLEELKKLMNQAKKYTVSIFKNQEEVLRRQGMLEGILDGKVFVLDERAYHNRCGLIDIEKYEE